MFCFRYLLLFIVLYKIISAKFENVHCCVHPERKVNVIFKKPVGFSRPRQRYFSRFYSLEEIIIITTITIPIMKNHK